MNAKERERFDALVQDAIDSLPARAAAMLDEVPVVVLDRPSAEMLRDVGIDPDEPGAGDDLCGVHSGTAQTDRSVEHSGAIPPVIHLFREAIVSLAGGWDQPGAEEEVYEQVRITLLHELGHQFGLDEDDLEALGYD